MTNVQTATKTTADTASATTDKPIVVVDLGRKAKKQIKRLRNGHGRLMDRVVTTVDQLQGDGEIHQDHQIVVVVVRQDNKRKGLLW